MSGDHGQIERSQVGVSAKTFADEEVRRCMVEHVRACLERRTGKRGRVHYWHTPFGICIAAEVVVR